MEKSGIDKTGKPMKYGIIIMIVAAVSALAATPLLANAECKHGHWDKSWRGEFMEKRQNVLHDKLALSASQQSAWDNFILMSKPGERPAKSEWSELSKLSTPDRLDHMLVRMKERQQEMESRAKSVKSFYAQLTPEQQKIFDESFAPARRAHERR
jgi:Spy/CpxP family protein refolding chaperone